MVIRIPQLIITDITVYNGTNKYIVISTGASYLSVFSLQRLNVILSLNKLHLHNTFGRRKTIKFNCRSCDAFRVATFSILRLYIPFISL